MMFYDSSTWQFMKHAIATRTVEDRKENCRKHFVLVYKVHDARDLLD